MIQLKIKTEYSFGKTFAPMKRVIVRLKEIGCTHAAIVDDDTWGHVPFYKACDEAEIKPLFGVEVIVSDNEIPQRMWFLAKNSDGLTELYRVFSKSHLQRIKTRRGSFPRLFRHDVYGMSSDILKFAGDIIDGEFLNEIGAIIDYSPASRILNNQKKKIAEKYRLLEISTSDNSFSHPDDFQTFQLLGGGKKMTPQYILESLEYQNCAQAVVGSCDYFEFKKAPMIREDGDLETLCRAGIEYRGMKDGWNELYETRLNYELDLIKSKDFESYFLIVADMTVYAKKHMLVGPSRGSSAGSLVCYLTRITEIDPIPTGLYFERFIDVTRMDLPDVDLDFPDNKRHIVFEYMAKKYGVNNIAHIGTITKFKPKSSLIQVCKALNISPRATWEVKTTILERSSGDARAGNCLEDTFKTTSAGQEFIANYPSATKAMELEEHAKNTGVHAAGLLICNDEITNYCAVDDNGIAHIEKKAAEYLGLLKIDVLGLRTLSILEDANVGVDWYGLKFNDKQTFDIFNKQRLSGIFQFEGQAMKSIANQIVNFESINDIDAVTALARPGPFGGGVTLKWLERRAGKPYETLHPLVAEHMAATYGLPVYQEQTLAIVKNIGLFDWVETSTIRKAMSKTMGNEFFEKYWEKFKLGAMSQGIGENETRAIWTMINSMGCLSGDTLIKNPYPNHATPKFITIRELAENGGYVRRTKKTNGKYDIVKKQQIHCLDEKSAKIKPVRCIDSFCSGEKETFLLTLENGYSIRATSNHKFLTKNSGWKRLDELSDGIEIATMGLTRQTDKKKPSGIGKIRYKHTNTGIGLTLFFRNRNILRKEYDKCQVCFVEGFDETHHIDMNHNNHEIKNLKPICRKCHRKIHGTSIPNSIGKDVAYSKIISIGCAKVELVYDISMPAPNHNFIANGIVAHNSWQMNKAHTYSYATISYWCAYLKAHFPLEFAAANLRNAKDENSSILLLREMDREGIKYIPFDINLSEVNWSVKDGKLVGGFMALKGVGEAKAKKLIAGRNAGRLTQKQIETIEKAENVFSNIYPISTIYRDLYDEPDKNGIAGKVWKIVDIKEGIPHGEERVVIGELIHKNPRNANEENEIKKRGGKIETGQLEYLDIRLQDDTDQIGGRIGRKDWLRIGVEFNEKVQVGAHIMVRAAMYSGIRYLFIKKYVKIDGNPKYDSRVKK